MNEQAGSLDQAIVDDAIISAGKAARDETFDGKLSSRRIRRRRMVIWTDRWPLTRGLRYLLRRLRNTPRRSHRLGALVRRQMLSWQG